MMRGCFPLGACTLELLRCLFWCERCFLNWDKLNSYWSLHENEGLGFLVSMCGQQFTVCIQCSLSCRNAFLIASVFAHWDCGRKFGNGVFCHKNRDAANVDGITESVIKKKAYIWKLLSVTMITILCEKKKKLSSDTQRNSKVWTIYF